MESAGKKRVGVLFGGRSGEHEVSIRSAQSVVGAIDRGRWEPILVGIDRKGAWYLHDEDAFRRLSATAAGKAEREVVLVTRAGRHGLLSVSKKDVALVAIDVVFPVLHGTFGEDGAIQGMLDLLDVPYVGAGVVGSAVGMDKDIQKRLLREAGLPVVDFEVFTERAWRSGRDRVRRVLAERLEFPAFVKPANLGSSVGISKVKVESEIDAAIEAALCYDRKIVVERGIDAREIECSVLGNDEPRASVPGEIVSGADFYSYEAKYSGASSARLLIPAPLPAALQEEVRALAVRVFEVLECSGMARVDFFVERGTDRIFVNELNTIPGFTSISMYPKLWEASGIPYAELITRLLELGLERHRARSALRVEL